MTAPVMRRGLPSGLLMVSPTQRRQFGFIFAECHIAYKAPAFFGDEIRTYIWPAELKRSSLKLGFEMRTEAGERLAADGWGTLVGYDYEAGEPRPIPDALRERIEPQMLDRVSRRA